MGFIKGIKKVLFNTLSFKQYLTLVSKSYFFFYRSGLLKNNPSFKYHYFLKNMIKKDDTIIDIGANLGYYSVLFSDWVGNNGLVYSVEPIFQMREVFIKNIGNRKNIEIIPFALGTENKKMKMGNNTKKEQGVIATGQHFVLDDDASAEDEFSAEMRKGSEVFSKIEKVNFIKCDVEGYETIILPEIENILVKHEPCMLVETRTDKRVFLLDFLSNLGFSGYVLKEDNKLFKAEKVEEKVEDDIIFIHKNKKDQFSQFIVD